ncbi:MAG: protein kinase [Ignavibacteriales bacterium]
MINTRFEIIKKLGEGRSSVYLCRDIEFPEKDYAIKILAPGKSDQELKTFLNEFFILQKLEHPNIIKPFEIGTVFYSDDEDGIETGSSYILMEFFDGVELNYSKVIYDEELLKEIIKQVCALLYYLHQSKYIYYDLKPENILVSLKEEKPQIRLIDLGLAEYNPDKSNYEIKGTAYYIAPELLKKETHDHSVDFYSLGVILYKAIYNRYPIEAQSELDIYKAAIEQDYDFPVSENYSAGLINILKKLLEKDKDKRYSSALGIVKDLNFTLDNSITEEFLPAKVFSCRDDSIKVLSTYISDKSSSEVFSLKGFDGVGKSTTILRLKELYPDAVLISDVKGKSGAELVRYILRQLIFSGRIFPKLSEEDKASLFGVLKQSGTDIIDHLRSVVILITSKSKFILLIDDFNMLDQFSVDQLLELIPFLQINNIKVIISESSEHDFLSSRLNNVREITLGSFTDTELTEFLNVSYSADFPKENLQELIISYADLIPGNIKLFIKDLIIFGIMKFSESGITFSDEDDRLSILKKTHFAIYDLRMANLSEAELFASKIISAVDTFIDSNTFARLLDVSAETSGKILNRLEEHNIIQKNTTGQSIVFTSEAIKKHIYSSLENKKELHLRIAKKISEKIPAFIRMEEARQYELAGEYEICYRISMTELEEAQKHSAFSYIQRILAHLAELPLAQKNKNLVKFKLCEVYHKLGDIKSALATIRDLKNAIKDTEYENNFFSIEGSVLISSGEYEQGINVINELLKKIKDGEEKFRLKVELAYADFEIKKYNEAREQCDNLINEKKLTAEQTGRCYNLKGMINIYQHNDMASALENFLQARKYFSEAGQPIRVSGVEVNIGNIYNIFAQYEKAEEHWKNASNINQSVGNLDQEGILLQSFGLFYMDRQKYDSAVESLLKAQNIFLSLGKENYYGVVLINLGEVYIKICEYQKALNNLKEAYKIFDRVKNHEEISEALMPLGKLYFNVGFTLKLEETFELMKANMKEAILPTKYHTNLKYLNYLLSFMKEEKFYSDEIIQIVKEYKDLDERNLMIEAKFLLISSLIRKENYSDAFSHLLDNEFIVLCSQNSILEAEREYFLGILSGVYASDHLLPSLEYFEKAYERIRDENIFELTWKTLFAISNIYIERGNLNKAKRYIVYTRELIYFIAEKIESPRLRAAYLQQNERLQVLKKLESFYPA